MENENLLKLKELCKKEKQEETNQALQDYKDGKIKRFTECMSKEDKIYAYGKYYQLLPGAALSKLGQYEDLEEQSKFNLLKVINAILNNGVWIRVDNNDIFTENKIYEPYNLKEIFFGKDPFGDISIMYGYKKEECLSPADYGKCWAFTKEELE